MLTPKMIAAAMVMMGLTAAAQAMAPSKGLGLAQVAERDGSDARHAIVSECYWTKVCVKWSPGHSCLEWTQKKVCGPPINASKAPSGPVPRIKKRL